MTWRGDSPARDPALVVFQAGVFWFDYFSFDKFPRQDHLISAGGAALRFEFSGGGSLGVSSRVGGVVLMWLVLSRNPSMLASASSSNWGQPIPTAEPKVSN